MLYILSKKIIGKMKKKENLIIKYNIKKVKNMLVIIIILLIL